MLRTTPTSIRHRTKRHPSTSSRQASTQAIPVDKLKQDIHAASASHDPVPRLRQLRQSPLYEEVWQAGKAPAGAGTHDPEAARAHARLAAEAFTTCHALDAVIRLSASYRFTLAPRVRQPAAGDDAAAQANDRAFFEQIMPAHAKQLIGGFRKSWAKNSELRQAALLSAMAPEPAARLGLQATAVHGDYARAWGTVAPGQRLGTAELLALVDYVHSSTGTFNAVNGTAMAAAYYGDKTLSGLMQVYSTALNGAIAKLCEHPYFGKTDIVSYKGINLRNPSGRFRLEALEGAVGSGKLIAFPNVLSATADPEQSYAVKKYFDGYTIECRIRMRKAFDADPFHDEMTMGERELIGPAGQRFVVTEKQTVEVFQSATGRNEEVDRFLLEPATAHSR